MTKSETRDVRNAPALRRTTGATTEDVIKKVFLLHEQLQAHYSLLSRQTRSDRMQLLFEWCLAHEARMLASLYDVLHTAPEAVCKRWFKYALDVPLDDVGAHMNLSPGMSPEMLVEETQRFAECLYKLYEPMEETAVPEDLTALLTGLRELEKRHAIAIRRAALDE